MNKNEMIQSMDTVIKRKEQITTFLEKRNTRLEIQCIISLALNVALICLYFYERL